MAKIISLFNHKGGVSKTTTTFHLGWKLAELGKKVLMIDADPQCNLTGLTLGIKDYDSLFQFYDRKSNNDIFTSISPVFGIGTTGLSSIRSYETTPTSQPNLHIMAGHIKLSELDIQLATAITSSSTLPALRIFIGTFYELITKAAKTINADLILIDMSPSISATNMCLMMSSDYFIIPTSPDFYCYQAIDSLCEVLPSWADKLAPFKDGILLPSNNPQMLGIISQNYRVYTTSRNESTSEQKTMAASFRKWADKIRDLSLTKLVPALAKKEMVIPEAKFTANVDYDRPYNLANIQDFNSLISTSQMLSRPIYTLTEEEVGGGAVWSHLQNGKEVGLKINVQDAQKAYSDMANAIIGMTK